jgi:hypothetical protein
MQQYEDSDTSEYAKYKNWMDTLLSVPFGKYHNVDNTNRESDTCISQVRQTLDRKLSFLEKPKDQIINIVSRMLKNPNHSVNAIGLGGVRGIGKCLAYGTPVLMYDGSIKNVENISCGELLMGDDSTPRRVLSLAKGKEEMYKIQHLDTGEDYTVNSSHILSLHNIQDNSVIDISIEDYLLLTESDKNKLFGYRNKIEFPYKSTHLDPRLVGCLCSGVIHKNTQVYRYIEEMTKYISDFSLTKNNATNTYSVFYKTDKKLDFSDIPDEYFINDSQVRTKLLSGIVDSVGTKCEINNKIGYLLDLTKIQTNVEVFSDKLIYLVRSLGFNVRQIDVNSLFVWGNSIHRLPVLEGRNRFYSVYEENDYIENRQLSRISVRCLGLGKYRGFEIDNNRRFVLGNFVVTHNTSIVKSISEALDRPYRIISLGGESDSSTLVGHGFTYIGSNCGRIVDILRETNCMNPIILIDELDKVSETQQGKEIIGTLIHLTDSTTNSKYNYDRYFSGIDFDLSKAMFIFTYNDSSKIDKILADRLFKIRIENYTKNEKLHIAEKHLIEEILDDYGFTENDINFEKEAIEYIINKSIDDHGMRGIKRKIETVVSRVNTLVMTSNSKDVIKLDYKSLGDYYKSTPVTVKREHIDVLLKDSNTSFEEDEFSPPPFGMYN